MSSAVPLLELQGISKTYPGVRALDDVSLTVEAGEVRALLGQNGAGKSTLMKIIAGAERPDSGTMLIAGEPVAFGSPARARESGIGIVFQELSLVPAMSVGENIMLGRWPGPAGAVDRKRTERLSAESLARVGLRVDPSTRLDRLGAAERQLVEIAKALSADCQVLLLDEPTASLSAPEAERLFAAIRELTAQGVAVIYVSHRLPEILEICDRVTVLRDGRHVGDVEMTDVSEAELARRMVGESVELTLAQNTAQAERGDVLLRAVGLGRPPRLQPTDLTLHAGEIVTVFGLVGAGRTRLARTLFGMESATVGQVEIDGKPVHITDPRQAIELGLGYVGEDRQAGLVRSMSVAQNIVLASLRRISGLLHLDRRAERRLGRQYVEELAIRTPSADQKVGALSGGNQQKVVLARWLCAGTRLLILDDPVRGIDVRAKEEVYHLVRTLATSGSAVLYLTSELREACALGDRVLVMSKGRVAAEFPPTPSEDEIMTAAGGVHG